MKKKYRTIKVDGVKFGWTVYGSGKERHITIWKDKREIYNEGVRMPGVTPGMIADIIKENKL